MSSHTSTAVTRLAHQIALRASVSDITSHGRSTGNDWYDVTRTAGSDENLDLAEAVAYLDMRGLIDHARDGEVRITNAIAALNFAEIKDRVAGDATN